MSRSADGVTANGDVEKVSKETEGSSGDSMLERRIEDDGVSIYHSQAFVSTQVVLKGPVRWTIWGHTYLSVTHSSHQ